MSTKSVNQKNTPTIMQRTSSSFASRNHNRYRSITNKDQNPLTDEEIQNITKRALKDLKNQRQPNIQIVDCIKGKPYCLKLGEKQPTTNNFKTFYNNFYSTIYNDKLKAKPKCKLQISAKENTLGSRALKRRPTIQCQTRESMKSKFTKNLDNIIDSCNKVMTSSAVQNNSLYTITESKSKRIY